MQAVLDYLKRNQARFVAELCDYLRFPSVSAQPQHKKDMRACAGWLVNHARQIGLEARLYANRRPSHRRRQNARLRCASARQAANRTS